MEKTPQNQPRVKINALPSRARPPQTYPARHLIVLKSVDLGSCHFTGTLQTGTRTLRALLIGGRKSYADCKYLTEKLFHTMCSTSPKTN